MSRPTLNTGDIWSEVLANASIRPVIDGQDNPGSIDLVRDEHLSAATDQIKARFYGFWNRVKVSAGAGLSCNFTGAPILRRNGTLVALNTGSINLPDNSSVFLFIDDSPAVAASAQMPIECIPLAFVTTSGGQIATLLDLRDKVVEQIRPRFLPEVQSPFKPGDLKPSFSEVLEAGWLRCQGQTLNTGDYPALFSAISYRFGGQGSQFRLPDLRGRSLVGAGQGDGLSNYPLNSYGGQEQQQLTIAQMPSHSHGVSDPGHAHAIRDAGHSHGVTDPGHAHGIYDPGHSHFVNPYRGAALNALGNDGVGAEVSTQGQGATLVAAPTTTGIQIGTASSNLSLQAGRANLEMQPASSNIAISANGGGAAFSILSPFCAAHWLIKI